MPDTLRLAGAVVAPHSHDDLVVGVHESGAEVVPAVSVLDFGLGFDVTEGPSGEANVALDLTEAGWTFGPGAVGIRHQTGDCSIFLRGAGAYVGLTAESATQCYSYGLTGEVESTGAGASSYIEALAFNAIQNGANLNRLR